MTFPLRQSSISDYLACPRLAAFKYLEGHHEPTRPVMAVGTCAHRAIESALRLRMEAGKLPELGEVEQVARDAAERMRDRVEWSGADKDSAPFADRAAAFAVTYVREVAPTLPLLLGVEQPFSIQVAGYEVTGTIDVLTVDGVRDTKTTTKRPAFAPPRNRFQLGVYALAHDGFTRPTGTLDYLVMSERKPAKTKANPAPEQVRQVTHLPIYMDADAMEREQEVARATIVRVAEAAERGDFPRNPTACEQYGRQCSQMARCMPWRASAAEVAMTEDEEAA